MLNNRTKRLIVLWLAGVGLVVSAGALVTVTQLPKKPYLATVCEAVNAEKRRCLSTKKVEVPSEWNPRELLPTKKTTLINLTLESGDRFDAHIHPVPGRPLRSRQVDINSFKAAFPAVRQGVTPTGLTAVYTMYGRKSRWMGFAFEGEEPFDSLIYCWDLYPGFGCSATLVVDVFDKTASGEETVINSAHVDVIFPRISLSNWPEIKSTTHHAVTQLLRTSPSTATR